MSTSRIAKSILLKYATAQRDPIYKEPAQQIERVLQYGEEVDKAVFLFTDAFMEAYKREEFPEYAEMQDKEAIAWAEKDAYERFLEQYLRSRPGLHKADFPDSKSIFYVLRSALNKLPKTASTTGKIDNSLKKRISDSLHKAGFDGNGRFRSVGEGLNALSKVLDEHGLEPDMIFSAHTFGQPSGNEQVHLAFKHPTDPFSPIPVTNRMIALSWTELYPGQFECLAYVT